MDLVALGGVGLLVLIGVGVAVVALIIILILIRAWYRVARADEALVIVGKKQRITPDGDSSRITVITGGGAIVNPLTQRAEMISLRARQIKMEPVAQSSNGVTVNVSGVALVKIGSDPDSVRRAAERFASQDAAIEQFTTEQLEGALRGVVATLTVEELMRDRQRLSDQIADGIKHDLSSQGLILDSFQIQGITDSNGYIGALGATEVERVKRDAEVAKINADREIRRRQIATDEANLIEQTALDKNTAAAKAEVGRANAEAEQAEALARAERQQAVLVQEAENTQARLESEVSRVADADLYQRQRRADADAYAHVKAAEAQAEIAEQDATAVRLRAEADAHAERLRGEARAAAISAEAEALAKNQEALLAQRALEALVPLMAEFAKGYDKVGSITVLGGDGASSHLATESATGLRASFEAVRAATGIDLTAIIQGRALGEGIAAGTAAATSPEAPSAHAAAPAAAAASAVPATVPVTE
ncbi:MULTISPECIES: SPFH domain-containing protein [Microbacterium]|uniref:Flotillin family protein n=1 Tax=Microbacterium wangchenii TaxID=2541726 RepID=A0ABX5SNE4_9MICO|nr:MULTISPECIES: flotillin family protein [Microbacterium]MCK6066347.1 flotillin family protein [Microbacterium sp. EYE_512]QBR87317.1 flotillin family protein [Microbacterium wangchenii]